MLLLFSTLKFEALHKIRANKFHLPQRPSNLKDVFWRIFSFLKGHTFASTNLPLDPGKFPHNKWLLLQPFSALIHPKNNNNASLNTFWNTNFALFKYPTCKVSKVVEAGEVEVGGIREALAFEALIVGFNFNSGSNPAINIYFRLVRAEFLECKSYPDSMTI